MLFFLILSLVANLEIYIGSPSEIHYSIPDGYRTNDSLVSDSTFTVLEVNNGQYIIVPHIFADTLLLPVITAILEDDTLYIKPPIVSVLGNFPDSLMSPSLPPLPAYMSIPPGLPENYIRNISFWLVWGSPPPFPWLWLILGILLTTALIIILLKRNKKSAETFKEIVDSLPAGKIAEKQALALLESENFIHGRWIELYTEVDSQYRDTVGRRFKIINKALTLNQISRYLNGDSNGRKYLEHASPLIKEIILQRYADIGSSKERATSFIKKLAKLRKEWTK